LVAGSIPAAGTRSR